MAVTRESVEYAIKVNTANAERAVSGLSSEFYNLRDASGKFATPAQAALYRQLLKTEQELKANEAAGKDVTAEYEKLARQTDALNKSLGKTTGPLGAMETGFDRTLRVVSQMSETLSSFITLIDYMTNPQRVRTLSNFFFLFSKAADFKGLDRTGAALGAVSDGIDQYSKALGVAESENASLIDRMNNYANTIRVVQATQEGFKQGMQDLVLLYIGFVLKHANAHGVFMRTVDESWKSVTASAQAMKLLAASTSEASKQIGGALVVARKELAAGGAKDFEAVGKAAKGSFSILTVYAQQQKEMFARIVTDADGAVQSMDYFYRSITRISAFRANVFVDSFQRARAASTEFGKETELAMNRAKIALENMRASAASGTMQINMIPEAMKRVTSAVSATSPWETLKKLMSETIKTIAGFFPMLLSSITSFVQGVGKALTFPGLREAIGNLFTNVSASLANIDLLGPLTKAVSNFGVAGKIALAGLIDVAKNLPMAFATSSDSIVRMTLLMKQTTTDIKQLTKGALHLGPGFVAITETLSTMNPLLIGLGSILLNVNNGFVKLIGVVTIAVGIILGGFVYAIKTALAVMGSFIASIGDFLLTTMASFEEKFRKAQVAVQNFTFTMRGLNREFGSSIGTMTEWNSLIAELESNTLFANDELQKMVTEIVQVGSTLGLTKDQMMALARLIPEHVKAGDNLYDATVAFVQALNGMGQGVIRYGLHVTDTAIEHSKFAKELGLVTSNLSDNEKAFARLAVMLEQSAPIRGKAAEQLNTITGASIMLDKQLNYMKVALGEQGLATELYYLSLSKLVQIFTMLPKPVLDVIGTLQDFGGVFLKISGTILGSLITVAFTVGLWKLLAATIATNVTIQTILTKIMTVATAAIGVQGVAVTSLTAVWANFVILTKGILITTLTELGNIFVMLGKAIWRVTVAVLSNPLFWKAALIAAAIFLVVKAFQKIEEETKIFSTLWEQVKFLLRGVMDAFGDAGSAAELFGKALKIAIGRAIDAVIVSITLLMNGLYGLIFAFSKLMAVTSVAQEAEEMWNAVANESAAKIEALNKPLGNAASRLFSFSSEAYGAGRASTTMADDMAIATKNLHNLKNEFMTTTEAALITAQTLGKPAGALVLSKRVAEEKMLVAKEVDEKKNLAKEMFKIDLDIIKMSRDAVESGTKAIEDLKVKELERIGTIKSVREAGAIKMRQALAPIKESLANLSLLPPSDEVSAAIQNLAEQAAMVIRDVNAETAAREKELIRAREDAMMEAATELAKIRKDETAQVMLEIEKQRVAYKRMQEDKKIDAKQATEFINSLKEVKEQRLLNVDPKGFQEALNAANAIGEAMANAGLTQEQINIRVNEELVSQLQVMQSQLEANLALAESEAVRLDLMEKIAKVSKAKELADKGLTNEMEKQNKASDEALKKAKKDQTTSRLGAVTGAVNALGGGLNGVISAIGQATGPWGQLISSFVSMLNRTPEEMKNMVTSLIKEANNLPSVVIRNIPVIIQAIVEQLPGSLESVFSAVGSLVKVIFSSGFWKSILQGLKYAFWDVMFQVRDLVKDLFSGKDIGKGLAKAIDPKAITKNLTKSIAGASEQLFSVLDTTTGKKGEGSAGKISAAIYSGTRRAVTMLDRAWAAMRQAGVWLDKMVFSPFVESLQRAWDFIKLTVFGPLIDSLMATGDFLSTVFDDPILAFKNAFLDAEKSFTKLATGLLAWSKAAGQDIIDGLVAGIGVLSASFKTIGQWMADGFVTGLEYSAAALNKFGTWIADGLVLAVEGATTWVSGIGEKMWYGFIGLGDEYTDWLTGKGGSIWLGFAEGDGVAQTFDSWGAAIFKGLAKAIESLPEFFTGLGLKIWNGLMMAGAAIDSFGTKIWDGFIKASEQAIDWFKSMPQKIVDGIRAAFDAGKEWIAKIGTAIFDAFRDPKGTADKLKEMGATFIQGVGDKVSMLWDHFKTLGAKVTEGLTEALPKAWESLKGLGERIFDGFGAKLADVGNLLSKLFEFDGKGMGAAERFIGIDFPWVNFAEGGLVPGRAMVPGDDKRNDKVPAMLSPGEMVIPRSVLEKNKNLRDVLAAAIEGKAIQNHYFGESLVKKAKKILVPSKPVDVVKVAVGIPPAAPVPPIVDKAAEKVASVAIPSQIQEIYDSLARFLPNVDLIKMVSSPMETITDAIRQFIAPYFKEVFRKPKFAEGGFVPGMGNQDSVSAMLSPGEFVLNRAAVSQLGRPALEALNKGVYPQGMQASNQEINVTLNIKTEQPIDESFVRTKIVPTIKDELRRASLDGRRVLAAQGVR